MNDRIKELRKAMNLSQEKFGELLGITKSGVSDIESGRRKVTDQHVIMLANNGVSEEWLRTGKGNMFVPKSKDEEIAEMLADIQKSGEDSFRHRLISALARLDDDGWDKLEELIDMISNK
jgi:transcriptional regulator with XRE-family HTH domain|nr:MAG TPA: Helix-turn-helix XRE-family like protein [Caudoviricetes sp.]